MQRPNRVVQPGDIRTKGTQTPMAKTEITMLRDQLAAANPEGSATRMYKAGETYKVDTELADVLRNMGAAEETNPNFFPCAAGLGFGEADTPPHAHRSKADAYDCMLPELTAAHAARVDYLTRNAPPPAVDEPAPLAPPAADLGDPLANLAAGLPVDGESKPADAPQGGQGDAPPTPGGQTDAPGTTEPLPGAPVAPPLTPPVTPPVPPVVPVPPAPAADPAKAGRAPRAPRT